eukprot:105935-Amphidinium_carterae.1
MMTSVTRRGRSNSNGSLGIGFGEHWFQLGGRVHALRLLGAYRGAAWGWFTHSLGFNAEGYGGATLTKVL